MYIHLHTIGSIGMMELGTVVFHFAPNRRQFHWSICRWILLRRKIFLEKVHLFVPSFFKFNKYDITIPVSISHGNRYPTLYFSIFCSLRIEASKLAQTKFSFKGFYTWFTKKNLPDWKVFCRLLSAGQQQLLCYAGHATIWMLIVFPLPFTYQSLHHYHIEAETKWPTFRRRHV